MYINISKKDIRSIDYYKLDLIISLNHVINGISKIKLSFKTEENLLQYLNTLVEQYSLIIDDEYISRKYISK